MAERFVGRVVIFREVAEGVIGSGPRRPTITLDGNEGDIVADGNVVLKDRGLDRIHLDAGSGGIWLGGNGRNGDLKLFCRETTDINDPDQATIHLDGAKGDVILGGNDRNGDIILRNSDGRDRIHLDGYRGDIRLGGNGQSGDLRLFRRETTDINDPDQATIHIDGAKGNVILGGNDRDGDIILRNSDGRDRIHLDGDGGDIWLGGNGRNGDLRLFRRETTDINDSDQATIHLDGRTGDIKLSGADCAEEFNVLESEQAEPGTVLVVDQEDALRPSKSAYDKRVVGVVSGAGDCRPGIVLDKKHSQNNRMPVALTGKVYCKVDAQHSPIEVGDLLTSSPTPGHAMKANDPLKAFGAVIGKALRSLREGKGMIPILVALQ